jgi:hypothetical protein
MLDRIQVQVHDIALRRFIKRKTFHAGPSWSASPSSTRRVRISAPIW